MCQSHIPVEPSVESLVIEAAGLFEDISTHRVLLAGLNSPLGQISGLWAQDHKVREATWTTLQDTYGLQEEDLKARATPRGQVYFWTQIRDALNRVISAASPPVATVFINPLEDLPAADAPAQDPEAKWSVP